MSDINLPPYNIPFTPSNGTEITEADISNTLQNYTGFSEARYFFLQIETIDQPSMNYAEIEIYDETGTNIALNKSAVQDSTYGSSGSYVASKGNNGSTTDFQHSASLDSARSWWAVDLGSDKKIAGIRLYGRVSYPSTRTDGNYSRIAPFRIFLYKSDDYTGSFTDGGTGPLYYDDYQLHSDDATKTEAINGDQQVFYYGIVAPVRFATLPTSFFQNKAIVAYKPSLPPYKIIFTPSSGTNITATDVTNTLNNYTGYYVARYFFIQLETENIPINWAEIEIYDPSGNNIALSESAVQRTTYLYTADNAVDDDYTTIAHTDSDAGQRDWLGIDLGSNQQIAGIHIYGRVGNGTAPGGFRYERNAPYRIFLYTGAEYTGTFANGGTGPLNYDDYQLHSDDAKTEVINGNQLVFYYGITAQIGDISTTIGTVDSSLSTHNAVLDTYNWSYFKGNNLVFTPSSGTEITETDVTNTLSNYTGYAEARYFFIQIETPNQHQNYAEIEIYDRSGTNIALTGSAKQNVYSPTYSPGNAINGSYNDFQFSGVTTNPWLGIDLTGTNSNKEIAGIRVYGRNDATHGSTTPRIAPFRIFLYKSADYTGTFANGDASPAGTGPLNYNNYQLHSDDATINEIINGNQQVFYYGINAQIGTSATSDITSVPTSLFTNNAIAYTDYSSYNPPLPPYNITFTPSSGTKLTETDITNTINNYTGYYVARYFFIQIETENEYLVESEIEIYDETGTNIALNQPAVQYNYHNSSSYPASKGNNGITAGYADNIWTSPVPGQRGWWAVDLGSDKTIAGITVYAYHATVYNPGGASHSRTAPFRIFLYKSTDYTGPFTNGGTGPLNYNDYQLHSDDATKSPIINGNQQVFYYGITAQIGSDSNYVSYIPNSLYSNNAIVDMDETFYSSNLPPYNITFSPSSGTSITETDVTNTLQNYDGFIEAKYFFIQLDTIQSAMTYGEIEIYDESGTNIAVNQPSIQSTIYNSNNDYPASKANNGINYKPANSDAAKDFMHTSSASGQREWWGVNLGSDKKIAGIRIYTSNYPHSHYQTSESYDRTAPFRIFLYKSADYTGTFADGGTGPLNYDNYQLHSSDVTKIDRGNPIQFIFYYGISAKIGSGSTQITDVPDNLYSNNAIVDIEQSSYTQNISPYNITFTPSSGTELTETDVTTTLNNYTGFKTARYFFLQLETIDPGDDKARITVAEIEVYGHDGNNIALSTIATDASDYWTNISNMVDGVTNTSDIGMQMGSEGERTWVGINLGSEKKIAGIKVYSRRGFYGDDLYTITTAPHRIYLYDEAEYAGRTFENGGHSGTSATKGPIEYGNYSFISDTTKPNGAIKHTTINRGDVANNESTQQHIIHYGITAQIGSATNKVTSIPDSINNNTNNAIVDTNYDNYLGFGNYYHMDVSMHYSDLSYGVYLPTVTFTDTGGDGVFTSTMRTTQLAEQGFTGFYEADFVSSITEIDDSAFENDTKVCVATIKNVTHIHTKAFKNCSNLRAVTLDAAVDSNNKYLLTTLDSSAFEGCSALKQLYIPDTVTEIAANLCKGCTKLEVAVMGYGIKRNNVNASIGANAFDGCSKLEYFIIPDTVTSVGASAFSGCSSLGDILIPETITSLGSGAFTSINSGCIVTVPESGEQASGAIYIDNTNFTSGVTFHRYKIATVGNKDGYSYINNGDVNDFTGGQANSLGGRNFSTTQYWKAIITDPNITTLEEGSFRTNAIQKKLLVTVSIRTSSITKMKYSSFRGDANYTEALLSFYIPKETDEFPVAAANATWGSLAFGVNAKLLQIVHESGGPYGVANSNTAANERYAKNPQLKALIFPVGMTQMSRNISGDNTSLQLVNIFQKNAATELRSYMYYNHFQNNTSLFEVHYYLHPAQDHGGNNNFVGCSNLRRVYIHYRQDLDDNQIATNLPTGKNGGANIFYVYNESTASHNISQRYSGYNRHAIFTKNVNTINDSLFSGKSNLYTITFEHGGTSPLDIKPNAFGQTGITDGAHQIKWNDREFEFSNNPQNVNDAGIFEDTNTLTSIFIPKGFPCIPSRFLTQCGNLQNLYWDKNSSVTNVYGPYTIYGTLLQSLHFPASIVSLGGSNNIQNSHNLTKITFGAGSRLKFIDGLGRGADDTGAGAYELSKIVLPSSIQSANEYALNNSFKYGVLDTMVIPSSMEYIPDYFINVYSDTAKINTIYIPNSITNIAGPRRHHGYKSQGYNTSFQGIRALTSTKYYAPSHLNPLNTTSFTNARDITYYDFVNFPAINGTVKGVYHTNHYHAEIGEGTITVGISLRNASKLISVNFPLTTKTISQNAFKDNFGLTYVTFHEGSHLTNIESGAFENCRNIFDIILPEALTNIGENAFAGCINLATVKIPYNVTDISYGAFTNCTNLEYVSISDTLYNDISNNINDYFSGKHIINYQVVPTVEFTSSNELTSSNVTAQLKDVGLYKGSIYTPTFSSSVITINPDVYADFPELIFGLPERFITAGSGGTVHNNTIQSQVVGAWYKDGNTTSRSGDFPLIKSIPDYNLYNYDIGYGNINNDDNNYLVMPGFTVILYNNLYDELNTYNTNQTDLGTTQVLDNSSGTKAKLFTPNTVNTTSSALLLFLNRIIHYKSYV